MLYLRQIARFIALSLLLSSVSFAQSVPDAHVSSAQPTPATVSETPKDPPPPIDPPEYKLVCQPNPAQILEPVRCELAIYHLPIITVKLSAGPEVEQGQATLPIPQQDGRLLTTRTFEVKAKELNQSLRIKNLVLLWEGNQGQKGEIKIPTHKINIKPLTTGINQPQIRNFSQPTGRNQEIQTQDLERFWQMHGPLPLERFNWELVIAVGSIIVIALGFLIGWLVRKWKEARERRAMPYVDPRPAHVIAFEALKLIEKDEQLRKNYKIYYQKLSEAIRAYLEKRYGFSALEMTSDEIRNALNGFALLHQQRVSIDDFLSDTDLVKFADFTPSEHALDQIIKNAFTLVDQTKEEEQVEASENQAEDANVEDQQEKGKGNQKKAKSSLAKRNERKQKEKQK